MICPWLVSPQGQTPVFPLPPPGVPVTLLLSWREKVRERGLSPRVPGQVHVVPPEVSLGPTTFIYIGLCPETLVARGLA